MTYDPYTETTVTRTEVIDLLRRSADYIETYGLNRGTYWACLDDSWPKSLSPKGQPACAVGSMTIVRNCWQRLDLWNEPVVHASTVALARHLKPENHFSDEFSTVTNFSDGATKDEVVAAMRATADELEAQS